MARLLAGEKVVEESALQYTGEPSTYGGKLQFNAGGTFKLQVLAMDAANANFGKAERTIVVPSP